MTIRQIHTYPDEVLRGKAAPVTEFGPELQRLIDDMLETMYAAPGIGLAAPQVGVPRRVIVIDVSSKTDPAQVVALANPEVVAAEGEEECEEGCLSVPGVTAKLRRAKQVDVRARDRHGNEVRLVAQDLLARAIQHEIDHLEGTLILDKLNPVRREIVKKRLRKQALAASRED